MRTLLALLVTVGAASALAGPALGRHVPPHVVYYPPCSTVPYWDGAFYSNLVLSAVPSELVVRRNHQVTIHDAAGSQNHVSVRASDAAPISHPVERDLAFPSTSIPTIPVRFEPGDGPALVAVSWDDNGFECRAEVAKRVQPVAGSPPQVTDVYEAKSKRYVRSETVRWELDASDSPEGELVLKVWSRYSKKGKAAELRTYADQNFPAWSTKRVRRKDDFLLEVSRRSDGTFAAAFENLYGVRSNTAFLYAVTFNGQTIKSGRFRVRVKFTKRIKSRPPKRIYADTNFDRYVNYCINGGKRIWSQNGRLYCFETGTGREDRRSYSYALISRLR
jgi:hypothetical protein